MNFKKGSPESAGIPSGCLLHFLDRLQKKQVPMHSFLLMRHDTLIAEGYYAPYQKDTLHSMLDCSHDDPGYAHDAHLSCRDDLQGRYEK